MCHKAQAIPTPGAQDISNSLSQQQAHTAPYSINFYQIKIIHQSPGMNIRDPQFFYSSTLSH